MTDVKFIIQEQEIGGHLNIISHKPSDGHHVEREIFRRSKQAIIKNIEPEIFRHLLFYLYNPVPPLIDDMSGPTKKTGRWDFDCFFP
jgi:hypothetical protein